MRARNDIDVARHGAKKIALCRSADHRHDAESIHRGLKSFHRIYLGNDDICPHSACTHSEALAAPAISRNDNCFPRNQHIGRTNDAIKSGLARSITIVKHIFCLRIIHCDYRKFQGAIAMHGAQTDNARRRFFCASKNVRQKISVTCMNCRDKIRSIVHREMRLLCDNRFKMLKESLLALPFYCKRRNTKILYQTCRNVILSRERIRSAKEHICSTGLQSNH